MQIIMRGKKDVLVKHEHENVHDFTEEVLRYKRNCDISAKEFCSMVSVEGLTLDETATLYADVQKTEGNNVLLFSSASGKNGKNQRFPLWKAG